MAGERSAALQLVLDLALTRTAVLRDIDRRLNSHGVSLADFALLLELHDAPKRQLRRLDLAERLGVTASGVTRQIMPLERIGVVGREASPGDARLALATLTDAGARMVEEMLPDTDDAAAHVLSKTWSTKEQTTLSGLLRRVRDR